MSHGFCDVERVENFGLFEDASAKVLHGLGNGFEPFSLNVKARRCPETINSSDFVCFCFACANFECDENHCAADGSVWHAHAT